MDATLEDLYRRHAADLVGFATVLVGRDDALDVVSDAVLATIERDSLRGVSDVRSYWFRAVSNTAMSWHRSRLRRLRRDTSATGLPRAADVGQMTAADARRLLSTLSTQQRAIVYLAYWHDLTPGHIAEMLGVSEGTIRKQLARGREQLRGVFDRG